MEVESLKKLKSSVEKCIEELSTKSDLTPAETKACLDGFELRDWIDCEIENCKMQEEYSERSYSRRGYSGTSMAYPRRYNITSYRNGSYADGGSRGGNYSGTPEYGMQGWYQSNGGPMDGSYYDPYYYENSMNYSGYGRNRSSRGRGYSRHSIGDRAVEKPENLMDTAGSEYEREQLLKFIHMIREAE